MVPSGTVKTELVVAPVMPVQLAVPDSKLGFNSKLPGHENAAAAGAAGAARRAERGWIDTASRSPVAGALVKEASVMGAANDETVMPPADSGDKATASFDVTGKSRESKETAAATTASGDKALFAFARMFGCATD